MFHANTVLKTGKRSLVSVVKMSEFEIRRNSKKILRVKKYKNLAKIINIPSFCPFLKTAKLTGRCYVRNLRKQFLEVSKINEPEFRIKFEFHVCVDQT